MKGLLLKDYYVMKRNLQIVCGMCAYYLMIILLGSPKAGRSVIDIILYTSFGIISVFLTSCSFLTIDNNKDSKLSLFIRSCPLERKYIILSKYIIMYLLLLFGVLITLSFTLMNYVINGHTPGKNFFLIIFIIFSAILIFSHLELPITLRFGQALASGILITAICLMIVLGLTALFRFNLYENASTIFHKLYHNRYDIVMIFAALDIVSGFLSYQVSKTI